MKATSLLLLCLLASFAAAQKPADTGADVIALENAWTAAEVDNNADALGNLMADTVVITQPDGSIQNKNETLAYVRDKANHWDTVVSENMKVHVYENTAIVTGTYHEKGTSAGKPFDNHGIFTDTWIRRDGKWHCVAGHDSYAAKE
jgi:ketosteroid isomerase-like protein